jgi:C_GCAxxG_C_C family probable redox protein
MKNIDRAVALFVEGFSCSQSVIGAYSQEYDLNLKTALKVSSAFGGGMGHNDEVCGAVSGALMVIGLKYGRTEADDREAKENTYALAKKFVNGFRSIYGSIRCTDLLGCNLSTEDGVKNAREKNLFETLCVDFVKDAAKILEKIL